MRIMFLFGGMPHYLISLINSINNRGSDVIVILPESGGQTLGKGVINSDEGIHFEVIKLKERKTWYGKPFFKDFLKTLKQTKPDIIVIGWPYILSLVFNPLLLIHLKNKHVRIILREIPFQVPPFKKTIPYLKSNPVENENLEYERTNGLAFYFKTIALKWIRKIYYSYVDATINYCDKAMEIQPGYGVDISKIFVCDNTPDTELIFETKKKLIELPPVLTYNPHRIIHIGRLVKWKRVELLIRAVARLKEKYTGIELVIVGKGPEEQDLMQLTHSLQIQDSVKWAGSIYNYEFLGKYLNASSVYVLAGMGGLSINEAMAFQKPIVCSRADGTENKLVRHGYNGLFFKEGDVNSLFDALDYLFSNPDKMKEMGKNSEKIIIEEININTVTDKYLETFRYVLKE